MKPKSSPDDWRKLAERELKASPSTLVWHTPEGIDLNPLYTEADLEGLGLTIPYQAGWGNMIFRSRWAYAVLFLGYLAATLAAATLVLRSRLGYYLLAVRDNERAAEASGINVLTTKLQGMAISAALTGAGGGRPRFQREMIALRTRRAAARSVEERSLKTSRSVSRELHMRASMQPFPEFVRKSFPSTSTSTRPRDSNCS